MRGTVWFILTSFLVVHTACTGPDIEECFWELLGTVRDRQTGLPIAEVEISDAFSANDDWCCTRLTDAEGRYSKQGVGGDCGPNPRVTWWIRFRKTGYQTEIHDAHEAVEDDVHHFRLDVSLAPE